MERIRDIMTPGQAAEYLQINRETVYRYIRSGKLVASRLGKAYRIPKRSVDLLLWATRTAPQVAMREYTQEEVAAFLKTDKLDEDARAIVERFLSAVEHKGPGSAVSAEKPTPAP